MCRPYRGFARLAAVFRGLTPAAMTYRPQSGLHFQSAMFYRDAVTKLGVAFD